MAIIPPPTGTLPDYAPAGTSYAPGSADAWISAMQASNERARAYGASASATRRYNANQTNAARRVSLAAEGAALPIIYGKVRLAPLIGPVAVDGSYLYVACIWCAGEIEGLSTYYLDGASPAATVSKTDYDGTTSQSADPWLSTYISGYSDDLVATTPGGDVGVAYTVLKIRTGAVSGWPRIEGVIEGRKVYDPRTTTTAYSTNPALHLADFLSDDKIGMGLTVDWTSVEDAADACDSTMSDSSKRREAGILINNVYEASVHAEMLRTYAGCLIVPGSSGVQLVPNRPASVSRAITASQIVPNTLRLSRKPSRDTPTRVEVVYTDTTQTEAWEDAVAAAEVAGVAAGTVPRRVSRVSLQGIQSYAQAYREAVERLNAASLSDLFIEFITTDEALADEAGDVVTVTHPIGLTAKAFRISAITPVEPGRWRIVGEEYDANIYSNAVETTSTNPDTDLPSPVAPPTPATPTLTEELYVDQTGTTYSRILVSWTGSDWAFASAYRVLVVGNETVLDSTVQHTGPGDTHVAATSAVKQGVGYKAYVSLVSTTGTLSTASTATLTAQGKLLPPSDVPSIKGYESGQFVVLSWGAAFDIDLRGYQVRRIADASYSDGGDTDWDSANIVVERIDSTSYLAFSQPFGEYRYGVKAVDSTGNQSANATWAYVAVRAPQGEAVNKDLVWTNEVVLADDSYPDGIELGATAIQLFVDGDESTDYPQPYSGGRMVRLGNDVSWYSFAWNNDPLPYSLRSGTNDTIGCWIYYDASDVPSVIYMHTWDVDGNLSDVLYWGTDGLSFGDTNMGSVPAGGAWQKFEGLVGSDFGLTNYQEIAGFYVLVSNSEAFVDRVFTYMESNELSNIHTYLVRGDEWYAALSESGTWASRFGTAGNAWTNTATTGKKWIQEHSITGTVSLQSVPLYVGADDVSRWSYNAEVFYVTQEPQHRIGVGKEATYPGFSWFTGTTTVAAGAHMRANIRYETTTGGSDACFWVRGPFRVSRQVQPLTQTGTETVAASGATSVTFETSYGSTPKVVATPKATAARSVVIDSVDADGFDLRLFDASGTQVSGDVDWWAFGS